MKTSINFESENSVNRLSNNPALGLNTKKNPNQTDIGYGRIGQLTLGRCLQKIRRIVPYTPKDSKRHQFT